MDFSRYINKKNRRKKETYRRLKNSKTIANQTIRQDYDKANSLNKMPGQERRNFINKLAREAEEAARQIINLKALYDNILLHQ